jgi:WD40 repeat protein/DNA-binding SARP family transcriptional activator
MLECRVLGALRVVDDGVDVHVGGPRQRRLLAMLLVHRGEVVSADRLAEAVFAGAPTPGAQTTLRSYVARLRRVLGDGEVGADDRAVLETRSPGYLLRVPDDLFDAARFERLHARGRALAARDDPTAAADVLQRALDLWRGHAYAEFADEDWAGPEAQRLDELRLVATEHLVDAELACGHAPELVARLERLVQQEPLRESLRARLMVALYDSGRQADALEVMRDFRALLQEQLGLDPSPELSELEHRILVHAPDIGVVVPGGRALRGYRLGERLGSGRDGTVHAASLPDVDRDLAIRIVPPELADRPDVVRTFEATMRQVASLHDEAVVPVHDHWREAGAAYVVMRRMHGGTLRDRLEDGPLESREVIDLAVRIGGALRTAADLGIVHGRVVPESILYDEAGRPYLGDFPLGEVDAGPDADVCAWATLVSEAMTGTRHLTAVGPGGRRNHGPAASPLPDQLTRLLATCAAGGTVPAVESAVALVVGELTGGRGTPAPGTPDTGVPGGVPGALPTAVNPYKGLRAFDEADAPDFFGRDDLVARLLARLAGDDLRNRFVLLVGASGSGKSSVVRAGLVPAVRARSPGWLVTTMVPGDTPFQNLAEGLGQVATAPNGGGRASTNGAGHGSTNGTGHPAADLAADLRRDDHGIDEAMRRIVGPQRHLLLVVDQFEELFTLAADTDQRAFVAGLLAAVSAPDSRVHVVATLRADFYDQPLRFPGMGAVVHDLTMTMPAMEAAQLEAAITGPADRVGLRVEPPLVAELVAAVVDEPAALPALQFVLYELAERRSGGVLDLATYHELGGVGGAVAARAELLHQSLAADEATIRRLFEHLVVVDAEGPPTRRRTPRAELAPLVGDHLDEVVEAVTRARLLTHDRDPTTRQPTIEIAHEALLHEWPRLRAWIEDHRGAIAAAGQLREAAEGWLALDRDHGALLRGARLDRALARLDGRTDTLPPLAREFLAASRDARDAARRRAQAQVARQAATNRRLRLQLGALVLTLLVALAGGVLAITQARRATAEGHVARARELAADAVASVDDDPELAVLLGVAAVEEARSAGGEVVPEAVEALHRAVTASRVVLTMPGSGGAVDWSPDGTVVVTEGRDGSGLVDVRDAISGDSVLAFHGHEVDVNDVAFGGDATMVATTGDDGAARVWDAATGAPVVAVAGRGEVWGPSFSRGGDLLAAAWPDEELVRIVDVATGTTVREVRLVAGGTSFSPVDDRLAIAAGNEAVVVDATTGEQLVAIEPPGGPVSPVGASQWPVDDVAFSPDGRWLATVGSDGEAHVWDAATGDLHATMSGHAAGTVRVDWSPDGTRLATSSDDGTARVWEVSDGGGQEVVRLAAGATRAVVGVAFSPDGQRLVTGDAGSTAARIFDVGPSGAFEIATVPTSPDVTGAAAFAPDGTAVVATADGAAAMVWDLASDEPRATLGDDGTAGSTDAFLVAPSPDGGLVATATHAGPVVVWDVRSGASVATIGPTAWPPAATWSPDGDLLAVTGGDGESGWLRVVDRDGRLVHELAEEGVVPLSVAFGPQGDRIVTTQRATGRVDDVFEGVRVWDWAAGEIVLEIDVPAWQAVFDPTGTLVATNDLASGAATWDATTGAQVVAFRGHAGVVQDLAFDPADATLATASVDGTVRLWEVGTGDQRLVLRGDGGPVSSVAFSPDGTRLVSVDGGLARVWTLDVDELVDLARARVTRSMTDDECRQYLHLETCP